MALVLRCGHSKPDHPVIRAAPPIDLSADIQGDRVSPPSCHLYDTLQVWDQLWLGHGLEHVVGLIQAQNTVLVTAH